MSKSLDAFIMNTKMQSAPISGHVALSLKMKTTTTERGPGLWKLNAKILESENFDSIFRTFWAMEIKNKCISK